MVFVCFVYFVYFICLTAFVMSNLSIIRDSYEFGIKIMCLNDHLRRLIQRQAIRTASTIRREGIFLILFAGLILSACGKQKDKAEEDKAQPIGVSYEVKAPAGLPPVPVTADNRLTAESIALGRRLFYDTNLSSDGTISCASCHNPENYFSDSWPKAIGIDAQTGPRNTPTALNSAYNVTQFLDGRAGSLEEQAGGPIANPLEMNLPHDACVAKLNQDQKYVDEFARVFGPGRITMNKIVKSIAAFERTLISGNSPFDRYQYGGRKDAIGAEAIRGLAIFTDRNRGNCATCHPIGDKFALFTDDKFHNVGAGMNSEGELTDMGRFVQTKVEADRGAFRTPSLRNVAKTAPYMHDGSLKTLKEVVDYYMGGGNSNPQLDKEMRPLGLSARDRSDLVKFLESLTGEIPANSGPPVKE